MIQTEPPEPKLSKILQDPSSLHNVNRTGRHSGTEVPRGCKPFLPLWMTARRSLDCSTSPNLAVCRWWSLSGSNRRPPACKAGALPAELRPHSGVNSALTAPSWKPSHRRRSGIFASNRFHRFAGPCGPSATMVGPGRFELPTSPLSGVRSNQLSYGPEPCGPDGIRISASPHSDATTHLPPPQSGQGSCHPMKKEKRRRRRLITTPILADRVALCMRGPSLTGQDLVLKHRDTVVLWAEPRSDVHFLAKVQRRPSKQHP